MASVFIIGLSVALLGIGELFLPYDLLEMILIVVSLAVAAIPQGMPAIMTVTLALGVRRMAERNAIVRRLPAVETLGSVTVIYCDKTGTLTRNEMTPRKIITVDATYDVTGEGYDPEGEIRRGDETIDPSQNSPVEEFTRAGILRNDTTLQRDEEGQWTIDGEPTEGALSILGARAGLDWQQEEERFERLHEIPFASERRYMATLHKTPEQGRIIFIKGAPEKILSLCKTHQTEDGEEDIDESFREEKFAQVADEGHRLLALAKRASDDKDNLTEEDIERGDLVLFGLIGMMDPPRNEAIEKAHNAGVRIKMITGDHAATARSIAQRMNIGQGQKAVTGNEIEGASDHQLEELVRKRDIFARSNPEHNMRLVEALQHQHEIVAMTGDGVNDAPPLKRADVGVAMGIKGSESAKDASEIVLADDNFVSIERAIFEGRNIYNNLKKTILFILPTNGVEALIVLAVVALVMENLPITPLQILWVNMITAVTLALSLAFEPPEEEVMNFPPRDPDEPMLSKQLVFRILLVSLFVGGFSILVFFRQLGAGVSLDIARTVAVNTLVAGQLFYLFNTRFIAESSFRWDTLFGNKVVLMSIGGLLVFPLIFNYMPIFHTWFGTGPMTPLQWLWPLGVGVALFVVVEIEKALTRRFGKSDKERSQHRRRTPIREVEIPA